MMKHGKSEKQATPATASALPTPAVHAIGGWWQDCAWSALSAVLAFGASALAGRALWCDEILRVMGQHYSVGALCRFEHLRAFCTQTPAAYIFAKPMQLLFGYEGGGCLVSILAAAVIALSTLRILRRLCGGRNPPSIAALLVATNPLLIYYGSELGFYCMWAAAFACAFVLLVSRWYEDGNTSWNVSMLRLAGLVVAGYCFIAFHFAGLFVWLVLMGVAALLEILWRGWRRAFVLGTVMAVPVILNLPMYLGASHQARHLGSQTIVWSKAAGLLPDLCHYVAELFPSLTGGWIVGVVLFFVGLVVAIRRGGAARRVAWTALAGVIGVTLFLSYSGLRDYMPDVCRYWVYGLAPALTLVGFGASVIILAGDRPPALRWCLPVLVLVANVIADGSLLMMKGRPESYRVMQKMLAADGGHDLIDVNHYSLRFLGGYYTVSSGRCVVSPCYWEYGREARVNGLKRLRCLDPRAALFSGGDDQEREAQEAGMGGGTVFTDTMPVLVNLASILRIFPEPSMPRMAVSRLHLYSDADLAAEAEMRGEALVAPAAGWRLFLADQKQTLPALTPTDGSLGTMDVYLPKSWKGGKTAVMDLVLVGMKPCQARLDYPGAPVQEHQVGDKPVQVSFDLGTATPGAWMRSLRLSANPGGRLIILDWRVR